MDLDDLSLEPLQQLTAWIAEARAAGVELPEAFTLATVSADGDPSARMLLARQVDGAGLRFYTNRESRKGRDLAAVPRAAAVFGWATLISPLTRAVEARAFEWKYDGMPLVTMSMNFVPWGSPGLSAARVSAR